MTLIRHSELPIVILTDANTAAEVGSEAARWVDGFRANQASDVRLLLPVEAYSFAGQRATA